MVKWPWTREERSTLEAAALNGYGKKEAVESQVSPSMPFQPRLFHPQNMTNYNRWANDPEVCIALHVLTDIIAGVGFYTEMAEEENAEHKNKQAIDDFCERVNLDEDLRQITYTMLAKGFCPVERLPDYDLKILPPETFYIYRDKYGKILKYTQEFFPNQVIASWEGNDLDNIILFKNEETTSHPYGMALTESIGALLDIRNGMNADIGKVLHRMGYPIPVMHTSRDKTALDQAIEAREPDQWITIGNVNEGEFGFDVIEVASRSQPHEWIDLINVQICEGLHAPLLLYLKNATEASATVMMESVDRLINGKQRYIKRRVEKYLFEPQVGKPVPRLVWGQPKTGLEKVTMTDLASVLNSPSVASNQKQTLLKMFFPNLPDPEWDKGPQPPLFQPFQKQPFQKTQPQIPMEQIVEKMNDLGTSLNLIETAYHEHRISLTEAMQHGDRAITVHLKRIHKDETIVKSEREAEFDKWMRKLLPIGEKKAYHVTVGS